MSRHPSPGPSHPAPQIPPQTSSAPSRRSRPSIGIAAGAEDVKYQGKYKDLKRKVKEIEGDNDRLHFKILQAKRSLQRMKLERAILYERMSSTTPPGDPQQGPAPPLPSHHQSSRSYSGRDRAAAGETEGEGQRRPPAPDPTRMDPPPVVPSPHMSAVQSPRHNSASHDTSRHLPPLPHLPPVAQYDTPARTHSHSHPPPAGSPPVHHSHSNSAHDRGNRSRPSQNYPAVPGQQYPENLPPVQRVLHSPPPHSDRDRPSRRIEPNDYPSEPPHFQPHSRHSSQVSPNLHPADTRSSSNRAHAHQRGLAPSPYINREDSISRQYELEREKGRERDSRADRERDTRGRDPTSVHSPHATHRRAEYHDHPHSHHPHSLPPPSTHYPSHLRPGEDIYYHDSGNPYPSVHISRSDTPGSGSNGSGIDQNGPPGERGGAIPSRPDSRTQYYEDRISAHSTAGRPSYRLRPVSQPNNTSTNHHQSEDVEFGGHDRDDAVARSQSHDARLSSSSTPAITSSAPPATSGPNNGTSGNVTGGGGGQAGYPQHPPPPPPPLGSGLSSHLHPGDRERHERAQTPSRIEPSSSVRKRSRNDMEMDIDADNLDNNHNGSNNNNDVGGRGTADSGPGSRRGTPAPGFSDERDRGSVKRYQREHPQTHYRDDREGSLPPPPTSHPPSSAGPTSSTQDQQDDSRMGSS